MRFSVFWREEKRKMSEAYKTINGLTKPSHDVGRQVRPTRPGIADVLRSLRHFPGPSSESHLFVAPVRFYMIKSVVQVQEKKKTCSQGELRCRSTYTRQSRIPSLPPFWSGTIRPQLPHQPSYNVTAAQREWTGSLRLLCATYEKARPGPGQ